jgi:hypothetical protein
MTARALIERRYRLAMRVICAGSVLFVVAIVADNALGIWVWVPGLLGFAVAWLTMAGSYLIGIRCPRCGGSLTALLMQHPVTRMEFRFCPYCGQDLDAEIAEP